MSGFNPSQVSFAGGEISPRLRGRVDSELYKKALSYCRNWQLLPQGPARMRAGTELVATATSSIQGAFVDSPADIRLVPMKVPGEDDRVVALTKSVARIFTGAGQETTRVNLLTNGTFDAALTGWTTSGSVVVSRGAAKISGFAWVKQALSLVNGANYRLSFRARSDLAGGTSTLKVSVNGVTGSLATTSLTASWRLFSYTFVGSGSTTSLWFDNVAADDYVDDVVLVNMDTAPASTLSAPWIYSQLAGLQFSQELNRSITRLVHGATAPRTLAYMGLNVWQLYTSEFVGQPNEWGTDNYPSIVEYGYQGRLWLGSSPLDVATLWGSKSGDPTNFTISGSPVASDALSYVVTQNGALRWIKGHRLLLLGGDLVEHSADGGSSVISAANPPAIVDQSAYGSAAIQACHIGDQVAFVARDQRTVRTINYYFQENGWVSAALSFAAEHLTLAGIKELHFARAPDPTLFAVLKDGGLVACTYDRSQQVIAWWRIEVGAPVASAAVTDTANGSELWLAVRRFAPTAYRVESAWWTDQIYHLERLPLHEVGIQYADSWKAGTVGTAGAITGLSHLASKTVRVLVDGQLRPDMTVTVGGTLALDAEDQGKAYVVGLAYTASLTQLPLEGGLQAGSSQGAKRRRTRVRLRLNNSALPLVDGQRAPERFPADPMDTPTDLFTGDVDVNVLGWEEDGALTIAQDLPFRTELLAIFGNAQVNEV